MAFVISDDIPVPTGRGNKPSYPFAELIKDGQSFAVPILSSVDGQKFVSAVRSAASQMAKTLGCSFVVRVIAAGTPDENAVVRVWRIPARPPRAPRKPRAAGGASKGKGKSAKPAPMTA